MGAGHLYCFKAQLSPRPFKLTVKVRDQLGIKTRIYKYYSVQYCSAVPSSGLLNLVGDAG